MTQHTHISIPMARDVVMLLLGTGDLVNQLFIRHEPDSLLIGVGLLLLGGPIAVNAWWLAAHPHPVVTAGEASERIGGGEQRPLR